MLWRAFAMGVESFTSFGNRLLGVDGLGPFECSDFSVESDSMASSARGGAGPGGGGEEIDGESSETLGRGATSDPEPPKAVEGTAMTSIPLVMAVRRPARHSMELN